MWAGAWVVGLELGCELGVVGLELIWGLGRVWSTWRASVDLPIGGFFDIIREAKFLASIGPVAQLVRARAS